MLSQNNLITREKPHNKSSPTLTDASNEGWGAVYNNQSTRGLWSYEERQNHINYLEPLAVFLGLKTFLTHERLKHMIDNSASVALINHMGTSH